MISVHPSVISRFDISAGAKALTPTSFKAPSKMGPVDMDLSECGVEANQTLGKPPFRKMARQLGTWLISRGQLLSEVNGIYPGLMWVEAKGVEIDGKQAGHEV